jgi:hypothetical protein
VLHLATRAQAPDEQRTHVKAELQSGRALYMRLGLAMVKLLNLELLVKQKDRVNLEHLVKPLHLVIPVLASTWSLATS